VVSGGTGANTSAQARINLGLASGATTTVGTMATQNANAVTITGGQILNIQPIAVSDGGTGAGTPAQARINLGLLSGAVTDVGTMATQNANLVNITGGAISNITLSSNNASFTGVPTAPTAPSGTNSTQIATTAFVQAASAGLSGTLGTMATQNANAVTITGGTIINITDLAIADGGTGASTAASARTNLGLGTMATQNANAVTITGGNISGITALAIADGGTGGTSAVTARTSLGLGTMATQNDNAVTITGGTISGVNGVLPVGSIIMWYGSLASIPTGWQLCNGSSGTPDLRDRFVVGAGSSYAVGAIGGSKDQNVVAHTHTASSVVNDPGHNHTLPTSTTAQYGFDNGGASTTDAGSIRTPTMATRAAFTGISVTTTVNSTGSSGINANLPPYHALCYIMRVI
jgi:hypothetical protein